MTSNPSPVPYHEMVAQVQLGYLGVVSQDQILQSRSYLYGEARILENYQPPDPYRDLVFINYLGQGIYSLGWTQNSDHLGPLYLGPVNLEEPEIRVFLDEVLGPAADEGASS